jgi:hypothetical protein
MNISTKYMYHLDDIRRNRKINVIEFCNDICTERQYRRYLSGENQLSQKNLSLFIEKLNMTDMDFYNSFHRHDEDEYLKISRIYNHINNEKYDKAYDEVDSLKNKKFLGKLSHDFYKFCIILLHHNSGDYSDMYAIDLFAKLINYPQCLEKKSFNFVEIVCLNKIVFISSKYGKFEASDKLLAVVMNEEFRYLSSNNRFVLPGVYTNLAIAFGRKGDYNTSSMLCNTGIKFSLQTNDTSALIQLYYMRALNKYYQGDRSDFLSDVMLSLYSTLVTDNPAQFNHYSKMCQEDFNLEISSYESFLKGNGFIKT